jgi:hypothetical protein
MLQSAGIADEPNAVFQRLSSSEILMKNNRLLLPLLLSLVLFASALVILASAADGGELFVDLPQGQVIPESQLPEGPGVMRTRNTGVNLLAAQSLRPGDTLTLNLFEDVVYTFVADSVEQASAFLTVTGHIQEAQGSLAVMSASGGQLILDIFIEEEIYQVRNRGQDAYAIYQIDQSAYPPELPPVEVTSEMLAAEKPAVGAGPQFDPQAAADDGSQIDILVVYTEAARALNMVV